MNEKLCRKCDRMLPIVAFANYFDNTKGKKRPYAYCRDCVLVRNRLRGTRGKKSTITWARRDKSQPEKFAARTAVRAALRKGSIIRQDCEQCGSSRSEAHHNDYSKPLDIRWLCRPHHRVLHWKPADTPLLQLLASRWDEQSTAATPAEQEPER